MIAPMRNRSRNDRGPRSGAAPEPPGVKTQLELRGLEPFGALGGVEWDVPSGITVQDGVLSWDADFHISKRHRDPEADFFLSFLDLAIVADSQLDSAVGRYARHWGPLWLCEAHATPSTHLPQGARLGRQSGDTAGVSRPCRPARRGGREMESVHRWRDLAQQAVAILMARVDLEQHQPVPAERFEAMASALPSGFVPPGLHLPPPDGDALRENGELGETVGLVAAISVRAQLNQEAAIATAVRQWLRIGDVHPSFEAQATDFALSMRATTLFGALGLRLAGEVANARPLVRCDYCAQWYVRTRRNTYCCGSDACHHERKARNARRWRATQNLRGRA